MNQRHETDGDRYHAYLQTLTTLPTKPLPPLPQTTSSAMMAQMSAPRYCLVVKPKIGDPVSKSFNGDSYPEGEIKSISNSYRRIETTTGVVFWRVRQSSA